MREAETMRVQTSRLRLSLGVGILVVGATIVFWSQGGSISRATANPPPPAQAPEAAPVKQQLPAPPSDYSQRAVAYICNGIPVTREQLGEYLIARMGKDRLSNLVNLLIIQRYCEQKGIEVTQAEIDAEFAETPEGMPNVTAKDFETKVLKPGIRTSTSGKKT